MKDNNEIEYELLETKKPNYCNFECCQIFTIIIRFICT